MPTKTRTKISPFALGYQTYGGVFSDQESAREAVKTFTESGNYDLYEDPIMLSVDGLVKVRIIGRLKDDDKD